MRKIISEYQVLNSSTNLNFINLETTSLENIQDNDWNFIPFQLQDETSFKVDKANLEKVFDYLFEINYDLPEIS